MVEENSATVQIEDGINTYDTGLTTPEDESLETEYEIVLNMTPGSTVSVDSAELRLAPDPAPEFTFDGTPDTYSVSGEVTLLGQAQEGAKVTVINDNTDSIVSTATSDANGEYSVSGIPWGESVHVTVQYQNSSGDMWNAMSQPYITNPGIIVDDFENENFDEYTNDTGDFSIQSDTVIQDNVALQGEYSGQRSQIVSINGGLETYPQENDTIEYWTWANSSSNSEFGFATRREETYADGYYVRFSPSNNEVEFYVRQDASNTSIATLTPTLDVETWYRVEIDWPESDEFTLTIYDSNGSQVAQTTATNAVYDIGGIAFAMEGSSGAVNYWDRVRVFR